MFTKVSKMTCLLKISSHICRTGRQNICCNICNDCTIIDINIIYIIYALADADENIYYKMYYIIDVIY